VFVSVAEGQPNPDAGKKTYAVCAGCHGFDGEGNELVKAPRLAGLEVWYLKRQMQNFADGIRGHLVGDTHGQRMAVMAEVVRNERELDDLLAYVATLPPDRAAIAPVAGGDSERGRQLYAICAACHGVNGQGTAALSAPGLVGLDGWYLIEQLRLYAEGLRGTQPADMLGQQMRSLSASFADAAARRDLAAFINSLDR
jgi:cytochrome c oxidase subunit 2